MRFWAQLSFILSAALSLSAVLANPHGKGAFKRHKRQSDIALRARGDVGHVEKRFGSARFTYFAVGLGACGATNVPSDFIVALNSAQYGSGGYCFQMITINYGGRTAQAQITDECPGCPYGGLDFSQGLFQYFADIGEGVLYGEWDFDNGGGGAPTSSAPPPPPTSTWQPPPPPTSTWQPPPPTSTWQPPPSPTTTWQPPTTTWQPPTTTWSPSPTPSTTSSSSSSSSSTLSSSSSSSTSSTASSASPSSTLASVDGILPASVAGQSLNELNMVIIQLAALISEAAPSSK